MSRRLNWDAAKFRLGERIHEVTDEVPTVIGPAVAGWQYLSAAIQAALRRGPLPEPSAVFLHYYKGQFPDGKVESWLQQQPYYLAALKRRAAKEARAAARQSQEPKPKPIAKPTRAPTKKASKTPSMAASPEDFAREEQRKLILRRRKEEGPRPPPVIEKGRVASSKALSPILAIR